MASNPALLFSTCIAVRWGDMDSYGHVNNSVYLRYLEEVRLQWFKLVGVQIGPNVPSPVVLQIQHTYLKPVIHPATVRLELIHADAGRTSLTLHHRLFIEGDVQACGEGYCKLVWLDPTTGRSSPLPECLRALARSPQS